MIDWMKFWLAKYLLDAAIIIGMILFFIALVFLGVIISWIDYYVSKIRKCFRRK